MPYEDFEEPHTDRIPEPTFSQPPVAIHSGLRRSAEIGKIAAALAKAQGEFGAATKDTSNPYFKSKYADLASIINATRKALSESGVAVLQAVQSDNGQKVVIITTWLGHSSGEWMEADLTIPTAKWDAQTLGSASTYGRRYALQGFLTVAGEDDDGNSATDAVNEQTRETHHAKLETKMDGQQRIAAPFVKAFNDAADKAGHGKAAIAEFLLKLNGYAIPEEITKEYWNDAIKWASKPATAKLDYEPDIKKSIEMINAKKAKERA